MPNIDINIKCGNSLINRFDLHENYATLSSAIQQKLRLATQEYKKQVILYKNAKDKGDKKFIRENIDRIKSEFTEINNPKDKDYQDWKTAENKRKEHSTSIRFDTDKDSWAQQLKQLQNEENRLFEKYEKKIKIFYSNAFEWILEFPEVLDDNANFIGFDIMIGNPPYIQLQKNKGVYEGLRYETFEPKGDIYQLFYERGYQLLKPKGRLCFITSNKWMRASYGKNMRKFFVEKTNPELLIDFAGRKMFKSATVDTNILMFSKDDNRQQTHACIYKGDDIRDLDVFIKENSSLCKFSTDSWIILSPIEQRIKAQIEKFGTPLKDWNIQINFGIKTSCNEAFIISGEKRKELIKQDPRSEEILRPILRGRDIKRYDYQFADLWLINTHNGIKEMKSIDIMDYPAIKKHLDNYWEQIANRKDKGDTPYNLRDCAYMEHFSKPKIIYSEIVKEPQFYFDEKGKFFPEASSFIMTGEYLKFLYPILHTKTMTYFFKTFYAGGGLGEKGYRYKKKYFENLPIFYPTKEIEQQVENLLKIKDYQAIDRLVCELYELDEKECEFIQSQ